MVYVYVSVHAHMHEGAQGSQQSILNPQELQLQSFVSCPMWVLRMDFGPASAPQAPTEAVVV